MGTSSPTSQPSFSTAATEGDVAVLVDIYRSLGGQRWNDNGGWLVRPDHCTWYGVTCAPNTTRVQQISLYGNGLRGIIPPSIGNLSELTFVGLNSNQIYGILPATLNQLQKLELLTISDNQLTGPLPAGLLVDLPRLSVVCLFGNALVDELPSDLGTSKSLNFLDLSGNRIYGELPRLGSNSTLSVLEVQNNNISGVVPPSMIAKLETLWVGGNTKLRLPASIQPFNRSSLVRLSAPQTAPLASLPRWLVDWLASRETGLDFRMVQQCDLRGTSSSNSCGDLSSSEDALVQRRCGGCGSSEVPQPAVAPPQRKSPCGPDDDKEQCAALVALYNWTRGDEWEDNRQWLSGSPFCTWPFITCDPNGDVVALALFGNNLRGEFPPGEQLRGLSRLAFLGLDYNQISGGNALTSIVEANWSSLTYMGLTGNNLSGPVPWSALSQSMPRLKDFLGSFNSFEGNLSFAAADVRPWADSLLGVELAGNRMFGSLPTGVGILKQLIFFDASGNSEVSGTVPDQFAAAQSLIGLDLRDLKNISGPVPSAIFTNLPHLRRLGLEGSSHLAVPAAAACAWARRRPSVNFCDLGPGLAPKSCRALCVGSSV